MNSDDIGYLVQKGWQNLQEEALPKLFRIINMASLRL